MGESSCPLPEKLNAFFPNTVFEFIDNLKQKASVSFVSLKVLEATFCVGVKTKHSTGNAVCIWEPLSRLAEFAPVDIISKVQPCYFYFDGSFMGVNLKTRTKLCRSKKYVGVICPQITLLACTRQAIINYTAKFSPSHY